MKLIGAGFPRTGTMSTKFALEQLGLSPCYHFVTQFERPQDVKTWRAAADGEAVDWAGFLKDFPAAVDWPQSIFYKQQMVAFPEAKVLLNVRDPEKWYESMSTTVYIASRSGLSDSPDTMLGGAARMIDKAGWQGIFHGRFEDKDYALEQFEKWNQDVIATVPADRLLVWEVTQGWEPLCAFLGLPVPDAPFPRVNDAAAFRERFLSMSAQHPQPAAT
ncbi:MAG TPA: sulfotransferase [Chloroflexota bacterium]|nr:sulfotransferase [Chloroflexota bacterium]